jgi:hypothetical protein
LAFRILVAIMKPENIASTALDLALARAGLGYRFIPCLQGTKVPAMKWRRYQTESPTEVDYCNWFADARTNIAMITTGFVIFDCDDPEKSTLVLEQCGDTPHKIRTPRGGIHLGYRARQGVVVGNRVRIRGLDIDIRAENGLEMLPPSRTERGGYRWLGAGLLPIADLPVAKIGWTRQRTRRVVSSLIIDDLDMTIRRARAYLSRIEGAISGQRGHDRTFRAACVLTRKFGLTFEQALPLLKEWSDCCCEPPWSDTELTHKLVDALHRQGQ